MAAKNLKQNGGDRRAPVTFGSEVSTSVLDPRDNAFLLLNFIRPVDTAEWFKAHKQPLLDALIDHGVVYLRDIQIQKENLVELVEGLLPPNSLVDSCRGGVTGRPKVDRNLFLTTVVPPQNAIPLHHEMSYLPNYPKKIFFYSHVPSEHGGATPVAFSRRIKKDLDPKLFMEFKRRGVCYFRNYYGDADGSWRVLLSWQNAFEVKNKAELEAVARQRGFEYEWIGENDLRMANRAPATVIHPVTQEEFLFNHAALLHTYSERGILSPFKRGGLEALPKDELEKLMSLPMMEQPYLAAWGDTREVIESAIIEELFAVYNDNKVSLNWKKGDLMIVDNILAAHGRDPYRGNRESFTLLSDF